MFFEGDSSSSCVLYFSNITIHPYLLKRLAFGTPKDIPADLKTHTTSGYGNENRANIKKNIWLLNSRSDSWIQHLTPGFNKIDISGNLSLHETRQSKHASFFPLKMRPCLSGRMKFIFVWFRPIFRGYVSMLLSLREVKVLSKRHTSSKYIPMSRLFGQLSGGVTSSKRKWTHIFQKCHRIHVLHKL